METAAETWCVYRPEWVRIGRAPVPGAQGRERCAETFRNVYAGKVAADDWRLTSEHGTWHLELRLPVQKGEFTRRELADAHAGELGDNAVVVPWGSQEELELLDYGTRQLNAT